MSLFKRVCVEWTPELDDELMEHIAKGRSFRQTGDFMGLGHDQVSSRFYRLSKKYGWQAK